MSNAATQQPRTVQTADHGKLDIKALTLFAILLAAGVILNLTVGKALAGISAGMLAPEFIISSFCLTILVVRPNVGQALIIGLIAAVVIQISASVKGPDFVAEGVAAMVMALIVQFGMKTAAKPVIPAVGTFVTTALSGMIYALIVPLFAQAASGLFFVMLPVVLLTAVFNGILVGALYIPVKKALKIAD